MRKVDKLWGCIDINGTIFPFYFDSDIFELTVFPEDRKGRSMETDFLSEFYNNFGDPREHKWIRRVRFTGVTSEGYNILFDTSENFSTYCGSKIFSVNWIYYYDSDQAVNNIDGCIVSGLDVENFYYTNKTIKTDVQFDYDKGDWTKFAVEVLKPETDNGGTFKLQWEEKSPTKGVDLGDESHKTVEKTTNVNIILNAYANVRPLSNIPVTTSCDLEFDYDFPVSINCVIKNYELVKKFFQYVTYRALVNLDDLQTFWRDLQGRKHYSGRLVWKPIQGYSVKADSYSKRNKINRKYIIEYRLLKAKTATLFSSIESNCLSFDHLVLTTEQRHSYNMSRFITILTAFEREYTDIFGMESLREEEYKEFKKKIIQILNNEKDNLQGKQRKWIKEYIKGIENHDDSFAARVRKVLIHYKAEMEPFIRKHYRFEDYDKQAEDIADRVGTLRNGLAHNRLDLQLKPEHLSDILIVEELLYCMRLKETGLDTCEIRQAINDLMGENLHILSNLNQGEE